MIEIANAGMTNEQVLAAATKGNADLLGLAGEIGTLETGKRADLVVLGGNPVEDLNYARQVKLVVQGGVVLKPEALLPTGGV
jgi:imidazolonepropionase-like amidohydrolase